MPQLKQQKINPIQRRALFDSSTLNAEERTVDVVFATETPVRMYGWDGAYDEILSFAAGHVRMQRLQSGAPVLDNHNRYSGTKGVLGIVENARIENGEGRATLRFSKRADVEPIWQDVVDGILRGISCGYRVWAYEKTEREGEIPEYRAIDWEPFEVSLAPVQADINSHVRAADGQEQNDVTISQQRTNIENYIMKREQIIALLQQRGIEVAETITDEELASMLERALAPSGAGTATATTNANPAPVNTPANDDATRTAAIEGERTRSVGITHAVRAAGLPTEFAEQLIREGKTIDQARAAIIEKWAEGDPNKGQRNVQIVGADETEKRRNAMAAAIMLRANPSATLTAPEIEQAREFRNMDLMQLAGECLTAAGAKTRGLSKREIASLALDMQRGYGMHSTSDFPIILGNTINRVLRDEYALAPQTFKPWTRQATATDFREMTKTQLGEVGDFQKVLEGGEYKRATLSEAKESYKVEKFGQIIALTWETLVNDDLDAFSRIPQKIANAAARKQSDIVYGILSANAALGDGVAIFHNTHKNLGAGSAITVDALGLGRKAMREQKGLDKKDFLNLSPSFLVVGPANEQAALQFTSSQFDPTEPGKINPWRGTVQVIVEPRITGNEWYLFTTPSQVDTVEYAFLEGDGELFTETKQGFEVDGLQIKARMVFGAKALDFRGMYKNPGA